MTNIRFKKGDTSLARLSSTWKKEIKDYQKYMYYINHNVISERDIIDRCCDLAGLKQANRRMKEELKRLKINE